MLKKSPKKKEENIKENFKKKEPFATIFDLFFGCLCDCFDKKINDENYENLFYFTESIERIKNEIKFNIPNMMKFKNILLIYNATKKNDDITVIFGVNQDLSPKYQIFIIIISKKNKFFQFLDLLCIE